MKKLFNSELIWYGSFDKSGYLTSFMNVSFDSVIDPIGIQGVARTYIRAALVHWQHPSADSRKLPQALGGEGTSCSLTDADRLSIAAPWPWPLRRLFVSCCSVLPATQNVKFLKPLAGKQTCCVNLNCM